MSEPDLTSDMVGRIIDSGFDPHRSSWPHKVCVMLHVAQGIIDNGGFEYFFENPFDGNPDLQDFVFVFDAVGATISAEALRKALSRSRSDDPDYVDLNEILWNESERNYANYALLERYIRAVLLPNMK